MPDKKDYYMNNKNLPLNSAEFEWTPERVKELETCKKDIFAFSKHFYIVNLEQGKIPITLYKPQRRVLKTLVKPDTRFVTVLSSRQAGKTTMMTIYALWTACFQENKRVVIVANKEKTAKQILARVRLAYEMLPNWLKPGVIDWAKEEVKFSNESSIGISSTSSSAARGDSVNVLIIDEMAFIPDHIMQEFWNSVIPIISSSSQTKIFTVSTPNGTSNMFYRVYSGAERGELKKWRHERIDWWEIPGRGKKWKADMEEALANEGKSFDQEFGNVFVEVGESAFDAAVIRNLRESARPPKYVFDDGHYKIWEDPDPNHLYAVGVDVAEGVGEAASVAQVLDITDLRNIKIVATFHDKLVDPAFFAEKLNNILNQWGQPHALIERNNCGAQVIDTLRDIYYYNNIVDYTPEKQKYYGRLGIYSHTNAKYRGVTNMRYWVNALASVSIPDIATVQEMETFIRKSNGTWSKKAGDNIYDDRVMSLVWGLFALEPEIAEQYYDVAEHDDRGRPLKLNVVDHVSPEYYTLNSEYTNNQWDGALPMYSGTSPVDMADNEMDQLLQDGWRTV